MADSDSPPASASDERATRVKSAGGRRPNWAWEGGAAKAAMYTAIRKVVTSPVDRWPSRTSRLRIGSTKGNEEGPEAFLPCSRRRANYSSLDISMQGR